MFFVCNFLFVKRFKDFFDVLQNTAINRNALQIIDFTIKLIVVVFESEEREKNNHLNVRLLHSKLAYQFRIVAMTF